MIIVWLVPLFILATILADLRSGLRVPLLAPRADTPPLDLTVIIPARDEAGRIERCLAGLAAQNIPQLRVIVLDDHSTDGTGDRARAFSDRLPGLTVLEGAALPEGWAGKCWACWQAAQRSTTSWLLFLDADTAPQPGMIAALVADAEQSSADMQTLLALLELETFWERVIMPSFVGLIQSVVPLHLVNDPRSPIALANGQCILIRRAVYQAVDGHRAINDSVLEDVRLAQLVKGRGYRLRAVGGPALLRVRMYTRFSEIAEGLTKNAVAGMQATGGRALWAGFRQTVWAFVPIAMIGAGGVLVLWNQTFGMTLVGAGLAGYCLSSCYQGYLAHRLFALPWYWGLLFPLGTAVYFGLATRALLRVARGAGVVWKGRTYH